MGNNLVHHLRLLLVTDERLLGGRDLLAVCQAAVRGGVTSVQLRLKQTPPRELLVRARELRAGLPVPVIINDRPDVAVASDCGVHLGPEDVAVALARGLLRDGIIGASVGSLEEAERAGAADYWGIGPWRSTATKSDAGGALGAEGFRRLVLLSGGRPCLAIGGVKPEDVLPVLDAGGTGVAVVSGILGAEDVTAAARAYSSLFPPSPRGVVPPSVAPESAPPRDCAPGRSG
jgi:thiamine-phosphate pyrophosphorylase